MSYSALVKQQVANVPSSLSFTSRRSPVYGVRGMVACTQPLAAEAGLRILQAGGNAADAAVAVAAALGLTEPCSTGAGGDAFALYYSAADHSVSCLQGNGASPAALTLECVKAAGITGNELPPHSALTVSVPGAVALWEAAINKWGSGNRTLADVLNPAIELAENGFPVSPLTSREWCKGAALIKHAGGKGARALTDEHWSGPKPGQLWKNQDLATTYRRIAQHGAAKGFYTGPVAEAIVTAVKTRGGVMELEDLANHKTLAVKPLSTAFMGHVVWEVPPPTAGVVALMALNVLEAHRQAEQQHNGLHLQQDSVPAHGSAANKPQLNLGQPNNAYWTADQLHVAIEACRLAFVDALARVADPVVHEQPLEDMICPQRAHQRYKQYFDPNKACRPLPDHLLAPGGPPKQQKGGDTCQWVVVDSQGNAASFIQSNYMGFGTGIVPEGCGFSLQNRCHGFNLDPGHPNTIGPRKRPYHTIMPGLLTDEEGGLVAAFGCMGGYMQPQGHVQLLFNLLELGMDPQAALDTPRFCIDGLDSAIGPTSALESYVLLEEGSNQESAEQLSAKGHNVSTVSGFGRAIFGKGQIILRTEDGVLCGGSDPRGDGAVLAW
eukprot:GHRR01004503.1.p1 GENE.GHRR01004503.1~~GHRR01004503.1.p1  ORF type:complete len:608 (+),score=203.40 GHRR01004503.1:170-1993(+)